VASVEAPDPSTVVFKLKFPSASLLPNLANPFNVIFPKKYLGKDPNYFKNNVVGSGPFRFKSYTRESTFEGERNPDYFVKDRPYLNGYKFFISTETSVRAAAIRSGRAYVEFRDLPLAEVEAIRKQLGDEVVVQQTPFVIHFDIAMNNSVKPFTDIRVRKALTLGLDRYTEGKVLYGLTASGTSGHSRGRARSGRCPRPSSRSSRASGGTPRRTGPRPGGSWRRRVARTASRWS
jgi:peptide/nickel transport system substrate-binding protein